MLREQVVTPRAGRGATPSKNRNGGAGQQRANARRGRTASPGTARGADGSTWSSIIRFAPFAAKVLLAVTLGALIFAGYRAAASAAFFQVRSVDVEGASRVSRDEVRAIVMRETSGAGVWRANLDAVSRELQELPWVRAAVVSRVLPSGLRVRIIEREPRMVARNNAGRLVWVDDEGVMLGVARVEDRDQIILRGLDESTTDFARQQNRERMSRAMELASQWGRSGVTKRVSELNLDDLRDVRVQLAGSDAQVEIRLGREDLGKRFEQALAVLDEQRSTPRGPYITHIDVSQGKRAIIGTGSSAHLPPADADSNGDTATVVENAASAPRAASPADTTPAPSAARTTAQRAAAAPTRRPQAAAAREEAKAVKRTTASRSENVQQNVREQEKRDAANGQENRATRPRRVSGGR